ncbi:aminodeoxychorismate lyase [Pseudomaricurvus sp. HS19]|uniref:aminodeoxychorismate lyase n=1 Tax=Pseudomaricurvus sp. HS19 TaxID=2692626 RepID=UPI0013694E53|nr:aminodeoxychorismate lyase [Pseudomaricurvus sp. HS19]MYM62178.1 aminodeoxychorismate lyase [Pseudomaricurvus sp. HS19]
MPVCVNGRSTEQLSVYDRAVAYGDGVFETCRLIDGQLPLWSYHRARLLESSQRLDIPLDIAQVTDAIARVLRRCEASQRLSGVIKCIVSRGSGGRGYGYTDDMDPTVVVFWAPMPVVDHKPLKLVICDQRLGLQPALAGMKHLNRLENVMLKGECQKKGVEDGVVVSIEGNIIETTHSNLIVQREGKLLTPRLDRCGVSGVMRQYLMGSVAPSAGLAIEEADLSLAELESIAGALTCNSIRGVHEVAQIDTVKLTTGDLLQQLLQAWRSKPYPDASGGYPC